MNEFILSFTDTFSRKCNAVSHVKCNAVFTAFLHLSKKNFGKFNKNSRVAIIIKNKKMFGFSRNLFFNCYKWLLRNSYFLNYN